MLYARKESLNSIIFTPTPLGQDHILFIQENKNNQKNEDLILFFLGIFNLSWHNLFYVAKGVAQQQGVGWNSAGCIYAEDFQEWEQQEAQLFPGSVMIYILQENIQLPCSDFEDLMLRYFQAAVKRAETYQDPILQDERWTQFLENLRKLEQRVKIYHEENEAL